MELQIADIYTTSSRVLERRFYRTYVTGQDLLKPHSSYGVLLSLPQRRIAIYIDNYFTSVPLFIELQAYEFSAIGTTCLYNEFPTRFTELKNRFSTKLEQNTLLIKVVDDILYLSWQDNIVLALSNIHTVYNVEDFREGVRRRPTKTSTNSRIVRQVFGDAPIKELRIPCFVNNYNKYIGGVDITN